MRSAVYGISMLGAVIAQRGEVARVFEPVVAENRHLFS